MPLRRWSHAAAATASGSPSGAQRSGASDGLLCVGQREFACARLLGSVQLGVGNRRLRNRSQGTGNSGWAVWPTLGGRREPTRRKLCGAHVSAPPQAPPLPWRRNREFVGRYARRAEPNLRPQPAVRHLRRLRCCPPGFCAAGAASSRILCSLARVDHRLPRPSSHAWQRRVRRAMEDVVAGAAPALPARLPQRRHDDADGVASTGCDDRAATRTAAVLRSHTWRRAFDAHALPPPAAHYTHVCTAHHVAHAALRDRAPCGAACCLAALRRQDNPPVWARPCARRSEHPST